MKMFAVIQYIQVLINSINLIVLDRIEPQIYCNRSLLFIEDKHPEQLCYFREIYRISRRGGNYLQNNSHCQYPSTEFYCRWRWFFCCTALALRRSRFTDGFTAILFRHRTSLGSQFNSCWLNGDICKVVRAKNFGDDSFKFVAETMFARDNEKLEILMFRRGHTVGAITRPRWLKNQPAIAKASSIVHLCGCIRCLYGDASPRIKWSIAARCTIARCGSQSVPARQLYELSRCLLKGCTSGAISAND